jgi:hypothetical protein
MNAQQARELMNSKKKSLADVFKTIETMANSGHNYATLETGLLLDAEGYQKQLITDGYNVQVTESNFSITW